MDARGSIRLDQRMVVPQFEFLVTSAPDPIEEKVTEKDGSNPETA
jgi:hypothetical protein